LEQIETDNLQNPERSVEVPEVKATVNENLWPLISQNNIRSAIDQWKRRFKTKLEHNGRPIQHLFL
jgi:hypothetical protein